MEAKKVSFGIKNWLKVLCVAIALVPCMFLFTACGGDPIEQDEAMTALTSAQAAMAAEDSESFVIKMQQRTNGNAAEVNGNMNTDSTITVYTDADGNVTARIQANGSVSAEMSSYIDMDLNLNVDYKYTTIDGVNYFINEEQKTYEVVGLTEGSVIDFATYARAVNFISESDLVAGEGEEIKTDFRKTSENSYNLRVTHTATETVGDVTATITTEMYYEIRDSKLTRFESKVSSTNGDETASYETVITIDYNARAVSAPTSLDGYTQGSVYFDMSDIGNMFG